VGAADVRVLVTGGAGFIGSNYVRHMIASSDDEIVILDALTYAGHRSTMSDLLVDPRVTFVCGDITDRNAVQTAMRGCRRVVHFAAESHVDRSIVGPDAFVATNCGGTNVMCAVAQHVEVERFVHISTDEVYGSVETGSSVETDPLAPRSPYSASKAGSDLIALSYHSTYGLPVVITRSTNNFGPYQHPEKLIPLFTTNLLAGRTVPLYGDGENVRDWCPVADNCAAIDLVARSGDPGEIYNVGAGYEFTNRQITARLLEHIGRDLSAIEVVEDRLGHDRRYSVDTSKLRSLGWTGPSDFDDALDKTVGWYRDNAAWWEPIKAGS